MSGTHPSLAADVQARLARGELKTRKDMAAAYAQIIRIAQYDDDQDVAELNAAIAQRWSRSGLVYIKKAAWAIVDPGRAPASV